MLQIPVNDSVTKKPGQQYAGPFKVLRRVGRLAYELEIPMHRRVHPVFTVTMLEPTPGTPHPFGRPVRSSTGSCSVAASLVSA